MAKTTGISVNSADEHGSESASIVCGVAGAAISFERALQERMQRGKQLPFALVRNEIAATEGAAATIFRYVL